MEIKKTKLKKNKNFLVLGFICKGLTILITAGARNYSTVNLAKASLFLITQRIRIEFKSNGKLWLNRYVSLKNKNQISSKALIGFLLNNNNSGFSSNSFTRTKKLTLSLPSIIR